MQPRRIAWISRTMHKRRRSVPSSPALLPASEVADRLRAHAHLCRQVAHESQNETVATELMLLAEQCIKTAEKIEPEPGPRLH